MHTYRVCSICLCCRCACNRQGRPFPQGLAAERRAYFTIRPAPARNHATPDRDNACGRTTGCSARKTAERPSRRVHPRATLPDRYVLEALQRRFRTWRSPRQRCCCQEGGQWAGTTTPTLFTPLHAIYTRPSTVAAILRTVPPPDGIFVRAIASVLGSKRSSVFGCTPDSLYQIIPSGVMAMPYGCDFAPPGESHIFTSPVLGFSRPRCPRSKSVKYTRSWSSMAILLGRAHSGSAYSWMAMVLGSTLAILLVKNSQKNGT